MSFNKQIPIPPFWTSGDAYLVINFLTQIIDAIREIHGNYLATNTRATMPPAQPGPPTPKSTKTADLNS